MDISIGAVRCGLPGRIVSIQECHKKKEKQANVF